MPNRFERVAEEARRKTNAQLEEELAKITPLTQAQLGRLLPSKSDKERLARLMAIVTASTSQNEKIAKLRRNMGELGGVVVKVLKSVL